MDKRTVPAVIGALSDQAQAKFSIAAGDDASPFNALAHQINLFPGGLICYDADEQSGYNVVMVSQSLLDMLGFASADEFAAAFDNRFDRLVYEEDRKRTLELIRSVDPLRMIDYNLYRVVRADRSPLWVYDRGRTVEDADGRKLVYVVLLGAGEFMEEQSALRWKQTKLELLESIPGIVSFDYDPETDVFNASFSNQQGETVHHSYDRFVEDNNGKDWIAKESLDEFRSVSRLVLGESVMSEFEVRINVDNLGFDWYQAACKSVTDNGGKVYRVVGRAVNIERYKQQVNKWQERARHDSLTGIANHGWLLENIRRELARNVSGALVMIDIDDFKGVNDTCGHLEGDEVLRSVAMALMDTFRATDIVGRYGGDEFAVFLSHATDRSQVTRRVEEIMKKINQLSGEFGVEITASVGVKIVDDGIHVPEQVIREADEALYQSKRNGKNSCTFA